MNETYDHRAIEEKWSRRWQEQGTHTADLEAASRPYYNLMMFPYPSAEGLHVGNVFAFVGSDVHARYMRARGHDVFEPMGFDAFGIHSENYAMKVGTHPARLVPASIATFRDHQLKRVGAMFDWSHQVTTTDPRYYRWTQWIFVQLFRAGLAYRRLAPVNWCPGCRTVLAAEQARGGTCERCSSEVAQRIMRQWFLRVTAYADRLLANLDWLDWSDSTKAIQKAWIGRSDGVELGFPVAGADEAIPVFTTRIDTVCGATYLALAPEHPSVGPVTAAVRAPAVERYVAEATNRSVQAGTEREADKTGVFTGGYVKNPVTDEQIPVWVSDYVLATHGTGAVMGVPAHDARDFAFARERGLPVVQVVSPDGVVRELSTAFTGEGVLVNSGRFNGLPSAEARDAIVGWLQDRGLGRPSVTYRLHDWCISRQRYWGPPIPTVHCDACGPVPVPEDQLPVLLPHIEEFAPDGSGQSPLARCPDFVRTSCPDCGSAARRETDVSDNFLDSAWYFLRYPSAGRDDVPFDRALTDRILPVDMYIGGNEHAVLHLMYARFLTMALHDLGLIGFSEPFRRFRAHGLITKDGAKMSKSRGNVVNPDEYLDGYGADVLRTVLMFRGPFEQSGDFRESGIAGVRRFLDRLWRYCRRTDLVPGPIDDGRVARLLHATVRDVTRDIEALSYNTVIAALMALLNGLTRGESHYRESARVLVRLVCPFAPFVAHELWEGLGEQGMAADAPWPAWDPALLTEDSVEVAVLVDGKVRARLRVASDAEQPDVERDAMSCETVRQHLAGRWVEKVVYVPGRMLGFRTAE